MSSEASKFWQNKQSCFFSNHSAVMLCKTRWFIISVWKNPWVRFPSLGRDDRIFLVHLTLFLSWETRHVSTVTIWKKQIASTWNYPSITSIKASTSSASVDQNALRSARKKKFRSCVVLILARSLVILPRLFRARWVCDWRMKQSVKFWSKNTSLMRPSPKFGKRELFANFGLAKIG